MADIDVKRNRDEVGPWILFLALITLVSLAGWALIEAVDGREVAEEPVAAHLPRDMPVALPPVRLVPTAVLVVDPVRVSEAMRAYRAHVAAEAPATGDHLYAAAGVARLAAALAAIVGREPGPDAEVIGKANAFLLVADLLVASPDSLRLHADWIHRTALAAVDLMDALGETRFPGAEGLDGELEEALRAAEGIRPEAGLEGQTEAVRRFFRAAEAPLETLAERASAGALTS